MSSVSSEHACKSSLCNIFLEHSELLRGTDIYVEEEMRAERLRNGTFPFLSEALLAGEIERGRALSTTGYAERMARNFDSKPV